MSIDATVETILDIPLNQLHDSPTQPRKVYNEAKLQEMADTMRPPLGRVEQPIVVRLLPMSLRPLLAGADTFTDYEVVFGHCRKRAAALAGLTSIPAIVRTMTDEAVVRAQIVENLARSDVHPIEEAEGFQALMQHQGINADDLAAETGKSRSYIYGRLKLLQACAKVREACLKGEIGSEAALLIARLRHEKLQERALNAIAAKGHKLDDGGKRSTRDIKRLLAEMFTLDLKTAIFATDDAALVPSAGACSSCPKLSGNAPEFADLTETRETGFYPGHKEHGNPSLCTDPTCWDTKHKAHLVAEAEKHRAAGVVVIDGNKARAALSADGREVKGAYTSLDDVKALLKTANRKSCDLPLVSIQHQRTGKLVRAVPVAQLKQLGLLNGWEAAPSKKSGGGVSSQHYEAERAKREAEAAARWRLFIALRQAIHAVPRNAFDLSLLLEYELARIGGEPERKLCKLWSTAGRNFDEAQELLPAAKVMPLDDQARLLMDCVLLSGHWVEGYDFYKPELVLRAASYYGIDVDAARAEPLSTPSGAAQAQEGAGSAAEAAPAAGQVHARAKPGKGVRYWDAATGMTWTGKGLEPAWFKAALASGKTPAELEVNKADPEEAGMPALNQMVDAGGAAAVEHAEAQS
jgi:ParB/RepB/Spo0J family partition protein